VYELCSIPENRRGSVIALMSILLSQNSRVQMLCENDHKAKGFRKTTLPSLVGYQ
jgi:hypothetical protein